MVVCAAVRSFLLVVRTGLSAAEEEFRCACRAGRAMQCTGKAAFQMRRDSV